MKVVKRKKGFKEFIRKFIVSLKKRPHNIALVVMLVSYVFYSLNLTTISNTTALVNKSFMGLCCFVGMLLGLLAMVTFLNAFPKRKKPITIMVILLFVISAINIFVDIVYLTKVIEGINETFGNSEVVLHCKTVVLVHIILQAVSIVLIATIPVYSKLLNMINTRIDLGETNLGKIEVEDE